MCHSQCLVQSGFQYGRVMSYVTAKARSDQDFLVQFRYANNSNYKNDTMIRKEGFVAQEILDELKRIIEDAEVHP